MDNTTCEEQAMADAIMIFGGLNCCDCCGLEASTGGPVYTDIEYSAMAKKMLAAGWTPAADQLSIFCPACSVNMCEID